MVPIGLTDRQAFLAEVSDAERGCIMETFDPLQFDVLLQTPEAASPEDLQALNLCLRDGTLLRVFLGTLVGQTGPLSGETSACLQNVFSGLDIRSMAIVEDSGEGGQEAMAGNIGAFLLAMSCLSDEEWEAAASGLGLSPSDRENQQCALAALGGEAGMVRALQSGEGLGFFAILSASQECGVQSPSMASTNVSGSTFEAGMIAPLNPEDPAALIAGLSDAEQACVSGIADPERIATLIGDPQAATPEESSALTQCYSDETLLRLFVTGLVSPTGPLSADTSMCIRGGMAGIDLRSAMTGGAEGNGQDPMVDGMAAYFLTLSCLNDEEWQAASVASGEALGDRESLQCTMAALGGPEGMAAALTSEDGSGILTILTAALGCGVQLEALPAG